MTATVIYPKEFAQTLHVAAESDEWAGVCGATTSLRGPVVLADKRDLKKRLKPGYRWCDDCVAKMRKAPKKERT